MRVNHDLKNIRLITLKLFIYLVMILFACIIGQQALQMLFAQQTAPLTGDPELLGAFRMAWAEAALRPLWTPGPSGGEPLFLGAPLLIPTLILTSEKLGLSLSFLFFASWVGWTMLLTWLSRKETPTLQAGVPLSFLVGTLLFLRLTHGGSVHSSVYDSLGSLGTLWCSGALFAASITAYSAGSTWFIALIACILPLCAGAWGLGWAAMVLAVCAIPRLSRSITLQRALLRTLAASLGLIALTAFQWAPLIEEWPFARSAHNAWWFALPSSQPLFFLALPLLLATTLGLWHMAATRLLSLTTPPWVRHPATQASTAVMLLLLLMGSLVHTQKQFSLSATMTENQGILSATNKTDPLTAPIQALRIKSGRADITCKWSATSLYSCQIFAIAASKLLILFPPYPRWQMILDDAQLNAPDFAVNPGTHRLVISLNPSLSRIAGLLISFATLIAWLFVGVYARTKSA